MMLTHASGLLDVANQVIGSDIEELFTRNGFPMNNITWLAAATDRIPVVLHKFDIDRKTGEATHSQMEAPKTSPSTDNNRS